jgi:hypothetical protein
VDFYHCCCIVASSSCCLSKVAAVALGYSTGYRSSDSVVPS